MFSVSLLHATRAAAQSMSRLHGLKPAVRSMSRLAQELAAIDNDKFDAMSATEQDAFLDKIGPIIEAELGPIEDLATRAASDTLNTLSEADTWQHLTAVAPSLRSVAASVQDSGATPAYHHVRFSGKEAPESWTRGMLTKDFLPLLNARRESESAMRNAMETRLRAAVVAKQQQAAELLLSVLKAAGGNVGATDGASMLKSAPLQRALGLVVPVAAQQGTMPSSEFQAKLSEALLQAQAAFKSDVGMKAIETTRDGVLRDALSRLVTLAATDVQGMVSAQMAKADADFAMQAATAAGGELDPSIVEPDQEHTLYEHDSFQQYRHAQLSQKQLLQAVSHKRLPGSIEDVAMPELRDAARVLEENSSYTAQDVAEMMQFASSMVQGGADDGVVVDADDGIWASKADIEAAGENTNPDVPPADPTGELDILKGVKPEQLWKVDFPVDRTVSSPELYGEDTSQLFREGTTHAGEDLAGDSTSQHPLRKHVVPSAGAALPETFLGVPTEVALKEHFKGDVEKMRGFIDFVNASEEAKAAAAGAGVSKYTSRRRARAAEKAQ